MCDLKDGFKLCSCDGELLEDPDWVLQRRDGSLDPVHRRGRALQPKFDDNERSLQRRVIKRLEDGTAFDFDYEPAEYDVLILTSGGRDYRFIFRDEAWEVDDSNVLLGWRAQMVEKDAGKLG